MGEDVLLADFLHTLFNDSCFSRMLRDEDLALASSM